MLGEKRLLLLSSAWYEETAAAQPRRPHPLYQAARQNQNEREIVRGRCLGRCHTPFLEAVIAALSARPMRRSDERDRPIVPRLKASQEFVIVTGVDSKRTSVR